MAEISLRAATEKDAERILEIYAPYIIKTAITFEYDVPTVDEFRSRIKKTLEKYPYIVACEGEKIVGYAYASPFKGRAAYDHSAEPSIYVDENEHKKGIGRLLYSALEKALGKMNITNLEACITHAAVEDKYLKNESEAFHEKMGYKKTAHFSMCGYKFGNWYDVVWMEKFIGEHKEKMPAVIPFNMIKDELGL